MALRESDKLRRRWLGRLILSGKNGDVAKLDEALQMGADINASDGQGTALLYAAFRGHTEYIRAAVARGADVRMAGAEGVTPLEYAERNGHHVAARLIRTLLGEALQRPSLPLRVAAPHTFDYRAWGQRLESFFENLKGRPGVQKSRVAKLAPAAGHEIEALEEAMGQRLPSSVYSYLTNLTAVWDYNYRWEPQPPAAGCRICYIGGGMESFCDVRYIKAWTDSAREFEPRTDFDVTKCIGIGSLGNGDHIVLDAAKDDQDPPTYLLSHEGTDILLGESLEAFLVGWEAISYVDPCLHRPFHDFVQHGAFKPESKPELSTFLREVLGGITDGST